MWARMEVNSAPKSLHLPSEPAREGQTRPWPNSMPGRGAVRNSTAEEAIQINHVDDHRNGDSGQKEQADQDKPVIRGFALWRVPGRLPLPS